MTWGRILAIPLIIALYYMPYPWADPAAGMLFALAGITDSLDGYLARKWGQTSRLGEFLDPVADKLIVAVALVLIVSKDPRWFVVSARGVIIGREIAISALREWMAEIGARGKVAVSGLAKFKTILQIVGTVDDVVPLEPVGRSDLRGRPACSPCIAAVLTLWSMVQYLRAAWPELVRGTLNSRVP